MTSSTSPPKYDSSMTVNQYFKLVEAYKRQIVDNKYDLLLEFINCWLKYEGKYKLNTLKEFKKIPESLLLKNPKHNRKLLKKYSKKIKKEFNITFHIDDETDSPEIKDRYILIFIKKALFEAGYYFNRRTVKLKCNKKGDVHKEDWYTIMDKRVSTRMIDADMKDYKTNKKIKEIFIKTEEDYNKFKKKVTAEKRRSTDTDTKQYTNNDSSDTD